MNNTKVKIFLLEPKAKSQYAALLIYADSEKEARENSAAHFNPLQEKAPIEDISYNNDSFYLDTSESSCNEIKVDIINSSTNTAAFTYQGKKYSLGKNVPKQVQTP